MDKSNIKIAPWPASDERALQLEYDVFLESGYIEPNEHNRVLQYDSYPHAEFLVATHKEDVLGIVRLILGNASTTEQLNFPTIKDFSLYSNFINQLKHISSKEILEIGTMAITSNYRKGIVKTKLIEAIMKRSWQQKYWYAFSSLDSRYYEHLKKLKMPFEQVGEAKEYMGSITIPTFLGLH